MEDFERQEGVAFFLISYTKKDIYYYLRLSDLMPFWKRAHDGGRKSFRYDELDPKWIIPKKRDLFIPYLDMVNQDLAQRQ